MSKNSESKEKILIENKDVLFGAFASLKHSEKFLKSARFLYNEKKDYQAAIPLATISIEESAKGVILAVKYRKFQHISEEEWEKLKTHKHKLTHAKEEAIKIISSASEEENEKSKQELKKSGFNVPEIDTSKMVNAVQQKSNLHSQLQELRESCFYVDWNHLDSKWQLFDELPEEYQDNLAFFCIEEAEHEIVFLKLQIEKIVNELRKSGNKLTKLPYPQYDEFREMKDFESIKEMNTEKSKFEKIKFQRGILAMQKFVTLESLSDISFGIFSDTLLKYFKLIKNQDDEEWYPHPMIKSFMYAVNAAKGKPEDGKNYGGFSDDSDLDPDNKPHMAFATIVQYKSGVYTVLEIRDIVEGKKIEPEMFEKIVRTEIILEREKGDEVTIPIFIEAMSVVGLIVKALKNEERLDAIKLAKEAAQNGRFQNAPDSIITEIQKIRDVSEWGDLSGETRVAIATMFVGKKYGKKVNLVLTRDDVKEKKHKARWYIMTALTSQYFKSA